MTSEDVLLEMPHIKYKKDDGRLYVMSERLAWIQANRDVVALSHNYADIKSQKISPEGKPKIQLQIVLHDNSTYTFHFVNPEGAPAQYRDRDQVKELLIQLLPKFKRKVNQELEEKNKFLSENPKLLRLYKDLVIDGIISTEEFWATHALDFLNKQVVQQDTGVSSGFLSGIQPETDGANGLRYNLTTDVIQSIFKTYPAVKRKHIEVVPAQMTESLFWTKFFQSHYFHRDRLPLLKDLFSDCAKADDKEMKRELEKVRMQRDLQDDTDTDFDPPKDKKEVNFLKNMIKRFNQHSIMVLKATERDDTTEVVEVVEKKKQKLHIPPEEIVVVKTVKKAEKTHFEDLEKKSESDFTKLSLSRMDRYLNGPIPDFKAEQPSVEVIQQSALLMRECNGKWNSRPRLLDSVTAVKILGELRPGVIKSRVYSTQPLQPEVDLEIRSMYTSLGELLRHFWSCFPPTTTALEEKLQKTHETLKKFQHVKMPMVKERLLRDHLSPDLLSHASSMIAAAEVKYNQWFSRQRR